MRAKNENFIEIQGYRGCIEKERNGLLELKDYLLSVSSESDFGVLPYWENDTESDCCLWKGIKCDLNSTRVIGLFLNESFYDPSPPLLNLSLLYPFEHLRSLNLSSNWFGGWFDHVEGYKSLGRLRELEILDLSLNILNNSVLPFLSATASVKTLILRQNTLIGAFPMKELKDLRNLELLDLSENNFNGSLPGHELADLPKLKALDLSHNEFSGSLERQGICELKTLQELDLSQNYFEGQIPLCLRSLSKLQVLDLSSNQISGKLPSSFSQLESLEYLSLSDNNFEGLFSLSSITNLSKLEVFKLSSRSNLLRVEIESSWQPKFQLSAFGLSGCNVARVPSFLMHQKNLCQVDLSNNRISGFFPSWLLDNNTELEVLLLQNNLFAMLQLPRLMHNLHVLDISANDLGDQLPENVGSILPNLRHMNLSSNGFQGNIPTSLGEIQRLQFLDVSRNNFSGGLPESILMGCSSLSVLKLSHNKFSGRVFAKSTNLTSLMVLSVDNNQFTGKIGDGLLKSSYLFVVDMSNNFLTGAIPSWIGELNLQALLMSNNQLEGTIPLSLYNSSSTSLDILDLSGNMLSGTLPSRFNSERGILYLHSNRFTGPIPDTLLENVSVLDLRNNRLSGSIPQFMNTEDINILLLRGNKLEGHIPMELCELSNIRILDLSYNMLNGSIPPCLSNMSLGLGAEEIYYMSGLGPDLDNGVTSYHKSLFVSDELSVDYVTFWGAVIDFAAKQRYDSYTGGPLGNMLGLDLSNNDLSGEIPVELGNLRGIDALNLSHNSLSGSIPETFSNLKEIESLDLSFNALNGRIPSHLTQLPYIVDFNVSYNNLSGEIPQGGQFNTFDQSSYLGNPLLCGTPTNTSCDRLQSEEPDRGGEDDDKGAIDMVVFYWSFVSGYVTILMGILVLLCFDSPLRRAWFRLVDALVPSCLKLH